jgi:hypothetical protein
MCGSPAKIEFGGGSECYGHLWQDIMIECTNEKDTHCNMNLSLQADFWNILNAEDMLTMCWNGLDRK